MRTSPQLYTRILSTLLFCFLMQNICASQSKNLISVTPIKLITQKVNLNYERVIYKNWSGALDVQFWFIDRRGDSFLEREKQNDTNKKNQGIRYSFGMKRYFGKAHNSPFDRKFYVGFNFFTGDHSIEQKVFANETSLFGISLNSLSKSGKANLRSSGVNINLGFKTAYSNKVVIDFGVLVGKSWTNLSRDNFLLYDVDSAISAKKVKFNKKINGLFLEPRFAVGYSF